MKTNRNFLQTALLLAGLLNLTPTNAATTNTAKKPERIPWDQIGAKAGANYKGDALAVTSTADGARLHCAFQKLDGAATGDGLWLTSVTNSLNDRFQVKAVSVGRVTPCAPGMSNKKSTLEPSRFNTELDATGNITIASQTTRFTRPGVVEEYSVSLDGVRQDFLALEKPAGAGELQMQLAVSGAQVMVGSSPATHTGVQLVLAKSGRKIAYSRLRVTDATGKELPARMEVPDKSAITLAVVVNDTDAVYPVRIDPTFSDANWLVLNPGIPGTDNTVTALAVDGSGNLYAGGNFTTAGGSVATDIAKWNGSAWTALGSGMNGTVNALAVDGSGNVYAGGYFTTAGGVTANYMAKWNGSSWSALGSGMSGYVYALAVDGTGNVYAGGGFTTAGGSAASCVAKWNGSIWSAFGSGMNGNVSALAVDGTGNIYAGGYFTTAGGVTANYMAKWNGSSWSALGSGMNGNVNALAVDGSGNVYAGGGFTTAGGSAASCVAKWNGSIWSAFGSGMNGNVSALAVDGSGNVYAGGYFTTAGGSVTTYIAKWNGSAWSALGSGMNNFVGALTLDSGGNLYAGGSFKTAGGVAASCVAKWNGSAWFALGSGMNGYVLALTMDSAGNLYAGGNFTTAGGSVATDIAKWNGSAWTALGSGMNGTVNALAVDGSGNVYAGGIFTTAGGSAASYVAKWNGSAWSALGSGFSSTVFALTLDSAGNLYAGGQFSMAGGVTVNGVAKWNGSSWSALGAGMNGTVYALAVDGSGNVYAGGIFTTAGGSAASYVAKWNGSIWSAFGSGMNTTVKALAVDGSGNVYAGGGFTTAGGSAASYMAKWNGSSWSALGAGMNSSVNALAMDGSGNVYAGGYFTTAGGVTANYMAKWNGSSWSALGSGMSGYVYALAVDGTGNVYAGGAFTTAGGKVSPYVAEALFYSSPSITTQPTTQNVILTSNATFLVTASGATPLAYQWLTNGFALTDATNSALTVSNVTLAYQTNTYCVIVTNNYGSITSSVVGLNVQYAPVITNPPVGTNILIGSAVSFSVGASGNPTPAYQWRSNSVPITGAIASIYNFTAATNANYDVVVTNTFGSVTSIVAVLNVFTAPAITGQPTDTNVLLGLPAGFSVTANANPAPAYQWQFSGTNITGATGTSLLFPSVALTNAGNYRVIVTNTYGSITSSVAKLNVQYGPVITNQPVGTNIVFGGLANFSVGASGNPAVAYQWRSNTVPIAGAIGSNYTFTASATANYVVVVTNFFGSVTSSVAALTLIDPPLITSQPTGQTALRGSNPTFAVGAYTTGGTPFTYQWWFNGAVLSGATNSTLTVSNADYPNQGNYLVVITNVFGSVTSSNVFLSISTPPLTSFSVLHDFGLQTNFTGTGARSPLIQGPDGTLYGTYNNGELNLGGAFKVNTNGTGYSALHVFTGGDGAQPQGGLVLFGSTLYGTTQNGGSNGSGTVFKVNTDGSGFAVLKNFSAGTNDINYIFTNSDGAFTSAGLAISSGTLYGTTPHGGTNGYGTLFKLNTDGTGFTLLKAFNATDASLSPQGRLIVSGNTLFGTANTGNQNSGSVFKINTDGTGYLVLHQFGGVGDGAGPQAGLLLSGNTLYGTTYGGNYSSYFFGIVFKLNTDGSSYQVLKSFTNTTSSGIHPIGDLVLSGSTLIGATSQGGTVGYGTVYQISTSGSGFGLLKSFDTVSGSPQAGLLLSGSTLYGPVGGVSLFKLQTDSTGYAPVWNFIFPTDGKNPQCPLVASGTNLFGTTPVGGINSNSGTVFRVNMDGSGYLALKSFGPAGYNSLTGYYTNNDGSGSEAGLTSSGNVLYGTTFSGGTNGAGTVFKMNPDGTGFTVLKHFSAVGSGNNVTTNSDGYQSYASLLLSGSTLYGTASQGGNFGSGTVFKLNTDGSGFTVLKHFPSLPGGTYGANSDGGEPEASLTISGSTLYGTTYAGGTNGSGTVFEVNTDGTGFAVLKHFAALNYDGSLSGYALDNNTNSDGANPEAGLVLSGSTLYGTASFGGNGSGGTLYKLNTDGSGFTVLKNFPALIGNGSAYTNNDGGWPVGELQISGSTLYGNASSGGLGGGCLFKINTDATGFVVLQKFLPYSSSASWGVNTNYGGSNDSLSKGLLLSGGKLYGTTRQGGIYGWGTIFSLMDVTGMPVVTGQPASQTVPPLGTANFSITATGSAPLAFQWLFNNAAIYGATNSSLQLTNISSANAGNYSVIAYNNLGSAASQSASLAVGVAGYNQISAPKLSGGNVQLSFTGNPGAQYALDRSLTLVPANWIPQVTNIADGNGAVSFTNAPVTTTNNFWRIRSVP